MGFLDDAIREHLDLKRRRGADPSEIERAEREALGPVRRNPEPSEDAGGPPDEPALEHPPDWAPFDGEAEPHDGELPEDGPAHHPEDHLPEEEPHAESAPVPEPPAEEPDPPSYRDEPPPPVAEPLPPRPAQHLDRETEEYDVEAEHEEDDDVLESTPEFLQDAPDHDRLWFEQRPPRDFDFDG